MLKKISKEIFSQKYLLASHYATYAMQDLIYEYLTNNKTLFVKKINFPLPELPFLKRIELSENKSGRSSREYTIPSLISPTAIAYLLHFLQFLWIGIRENETYDVVIAENSLLVLASLILKKLGKVRRVIYYSHGKAGDRFAKSVLNMLYSKLDRIVARFSDSNWLLSKKMVKVRVAQGIDERTVFWVPTALQLSKMKRDKNNFTKNLLFLGTINEMNGVMLLPAIIASIKKKFPLVRINIIGDGPLLKTLKDQVDAQGLQRNFKFLGIQQFSDYKDTLTKYFVGLAPYVPSKENLLQSTDPMKLRLYMAACLPIITNKGFPFSKEIIENQLGFTVEYSSEAYAQAVLKLLANKQAVKKIRQKEFEYSKQFDQEEVFRKPLERIFL